jgi:16S rRNA A1518/A1519 N6-dimethyltransferase RsmA/KsgA/DIM1 with predicted DNA glycosylase/AP lyase activity
MVIHAQPKKNNLYEIKNLNSLEKITNILFSSKRKMINKNIFKLLDYSKINEIPGINLKSRPLEIKPDIYYKIAELYEGI